MINQLKAFMVESKWVCGRDPVALRTMVCTSSSPRTELEASSGLESSLPSPVDCLSAWGHAWGTHPKRFCGHTCSENATHPPRVMACIPDRVLHAHPRTLCPCHKPLTLRTEPPRSVSPSTLQSSPRLKPTFGKCHMHSPQSKTALYC